CGVEYSLVGCKRVRCVRTDPVECCRDVTLMQLRSELMHEDRVHSEQILAWARGAQSEDRTRVKEVWPEHPRYCGPEFRALFEALERPVGEKRERLRRVRWRAKLPQGYRRGGPDRSRGLSVLDDRDQLSRE